MSELEAALRSVAVLVAHGGPPEDVFAAISEQAARVCRVGGAAVVRFGDSGASVAGRWGQVVLGLGGALGLVRNTGLPARVEEVGPTVRESAAAPVVVEDAVWGAIVLEAFAGEQLPPDAEARLTSFAELASLALAGADARERLLESRARLVRTADEERRRLERNLHDGAQQRLVSARLALRMVHVEDPGIAAQLDAIGDELGLALEELRELARGLHPAALNRGLGAAIGALASRAPLPVSYDVPDERVAPEVEVAAYYVVSEAITNAVKHADASSMRVDVRIEDSWLRLEVADDGRGGASFGEGSGLVGLRDRVEALRGRLQVTSGAGGTTLRAELPL
jgi:signal transduction histidine kinase